jgi:two-component system NarL family sensor kinase
VKTTRPIFPAEIRRRARLTKALAALKHRLAEAEGTLRAIRSGEVDAVVGTGRRRARVFTLDGAEHAYRVLIESMNEGALTLTADKTILYANQCFARMVQCPLEQVIGGSFRRFLSPVDRAALHALMKRAAKAGGKIEVRLHGATGPPRPARLSFRPLTGPAAAGATFGLVVTDMAEARRTEDLLRALTHRVVQVQEAERGSVALELHDNITQLLVAVQFSSQALTAKLSARDGPAKREAAKLRTLLGQTAAEVERISRNLRPSILDQLGLFAVLRATCTEFATRTGLAVSLTGGLLAERLPAEAELALYRIVQEALKNIEKHARARRVTVALRPAGTFVQLLINDDGVGFDAKHHAARRKGQGVLGLAGMRERAAYVGGTLTVKSGLRAGTEIEVRIPLPPGTAATAA